MKTIKYVVGKVSELKVCKIDKIELRNNTIYSYSENKGTVIGNYRVIPNEMLYQIEELLNVKSKKIENKSNKKVYHYTNGKIEVNIKREEETKDIVELKVIRKGTKKKKEIEETKKEVKTKKEKDDKKKYKNKAEILYSNGIISVIKSVLDIMELSNNIEYIHIGNGKITIGDGETDMCIGRYRMIANKVIEEIDEIIKENSVELKENKIITMYKSKFKLSFEVVNDKPKEILLKRE